MNEKWYARFPVLIGSEIYFVAGSDLFKIQKTGGIPELCFTSTSDLGDLVSIDQTKIACVSNEDGGPDIYIFEIQTRELKRLTFFEQSIKIVKYEDGYLYFLSNKDSIFRQDLYLYRQNLEEGDIEKLEIGPISWVHTQKVTSQLQAKKLHDLVKQNKGELISSSFTPEFTNIFTTTSTNTAIETVNSDKKQEDIFVVLQKHGYGYINWKGYKGGTKGTLWINGKKLINLEGNAIKPFLVNDRVYFLADHKNQGNIYSCKLDGTDFTQHTHHTDFYCRDLQKCGNYLLYCTGGRLGIYDLEKQKDTLIKLDGGMPHPEGRIFMPEPHKYLTSVDIEKNNLVFAIRGKVYSCGIWSGGMKRLTNQLRFKITGFLHDKKIFAFKENPEGSLHIFENDKEIKNFKFDFGKIAAYLPAPKAEKIAYINHRNELHIFDYNEGKDILVHKAIKRIGSFDWSFDSRWVVFSASKYMNKSKIFLYNVESGEEHELTSGAFDDFSPVFDQEGNYIFFLSNRLVQCVPDGLRTGLGFKDISKVYLITLKKDHIPLMPWKDLEKEEDKDKKDETAEEKKGDKDSEIIEKKEEEKLEIDLEGIEERIVSLPMKEKKYIHIESLNDDRILVSYCKNDAEEDEEDEEKGGMSVDVFCMKNLTSDLLYRNISYFIQSLDKEHSIIVEGPKLKILKSGEKGDDSISGYKKGGIFDWSRWRYTVNPKEEWHQMMQEVWWLMNEFFWSPQMAGVDWQKIWKKYEPFVNNIRTRQELNDLFDEIQGEVGTSHAFVWETGVHDFSLKRGFLGAKFEWDKNQKAYKIIKIYENDFAQDIMNPLRTPGMNIKEGEYLIAIDGVKLDENNPPEKELIGKSQTWVNLEIKNSNLKLKEISSNSEEKSEITEGQTGISEENKSEIRNIEIKTLSKEKPLIYRTWVEENRKYIAQKTDNQVGYIHIPDMQACGYREFFQSYLQEYDKKSIIIDARYNSGGNISYLLIDQLRRLRTGLDCTRWHGTIEIPMESPRGAFVLLVNAHTCSDGDVFAKQFKILNLGKILGEQTWGGVVGINPRYRLVDGGLTSQPEFALWMPDVGYNLENTGVEPDEEVKNDPFKIEGQENDIQLNAAIIEASLIKKEVEFEELLFKTDHPIR